MKIECNNIGGSMYLVEALDTYKTRNIPDKALQRIPEPGEKFEVSKERLDVLLGNNSYNLAFVKLVEEPKEEKKEEKKEVKPIKRTKKKIK